jgi:uncharacterized protein
MIAVDTNVLVYAHVPSFKQHTVALAALERLVNAGATWAIPWPCAHEFCAVVTNKKWRPDALDVKGAVDILRAWSQAPGLRFLGASASHMQNFCQTLLLSGVSGGAIHDARIVATCLDHNVSELWSADRDFSKFPGLRVRNPLVG